MPRYFLEVSYKGTRYAGSQVQANALTVQAELERALGIYLRSPVTLTGSSRTDAGVHALQNFYHFDWPDPIPEKAAYNITAILPQDVVANRLMEVGPEAHCRFDALSREYEYYLTRTRNPFLVDRALFYPYSLNLEAMDRAALAIKEYRDFTSFSKRNTQAKTFECGILESGWIRGEETISYHVKANRFLRGMVRGLVGTMLQVGRGKISDKEFRNIIEGRDCTKADFSVPGHGLFLKKVSYADDYFARK